MQLVSFNLFRTLGLPDTSFIKPDDFLNRPDAYRAQLEAADWVLFPEYWQLNSLLFGFNCRIFPSEATYRIGHNKVEMTRVCSAVNPKSLPTTHIAPNTPLEAERLWALMDPPFVAKLSKASQGLGVWLIRDQTEWRQYVDLADCLYVQEHLPIDRDLRIVLVGDEIIAAYWRHRSDTGFHTNVSRGGQVSYDPVPEAALALVRDTAAKLRINHAGFDVAMVGDQPFLLEFNRLFGNQGIPGGGETITRAMLNYLNKHQHDGRPMGPGRPGGHDVLGIAV